MVRMGKEGWARDGRDQEDARRVGWGDQGLDVFGLGRPRKDSRAKPSGSLRPPVAQGIQELKAQVFVAATSGNQITSGTDTVAEVILVP